MTLKLIFGDKIRNEVLEILSGQHLFERKGTEPQLHILSPWISDVDIEFSDIYVLKKKRNNDAFLLLYYNIKSINLPYALLILKLLGRFDACGHMPCEINVVTLPPDERHYSPVYLPKVKILLDFLDEIGCNIFVNPKLHSKLLLTNDLALLGSFNLSSSALYYREEIGVSIDDLGNLDKLESYFYHVMHESEPYGYSSSLKYGLHLDIDAIVRDTARGAKEWEARIEDARERERLRKNRITRGWLFDQIIKDAIVVSYGRFHEFGWEFGGYDNFIKSYVHDLNLFYFLNLRNVISSADPLIKGKDWVKGFFKYEGDESIDSIMEFLNNKFARKTIPDIKPRIKSLK